MVRFPILNGPVMIAGRDFAVNDIDGRVFSFGAEEGLRTGK
jgi:hypothetical protein